MSKEITRVKTVPKTTKADGDIFLATVNQEPFNLFTEWDEIVVKNNSSTTSVTVKINEDNNQRSKVMGGSKMKWDKTRIKSVLFEANGSIAQDEIQVALTKIKEDKNFLEKVIG